MLFTRCVNHDNQLRRLRIPVFPRRSRFNVGGLGANGGDPIPYLLGNELGAIIRTYRQTAN